MLLAAVALAGALLDVADAKPKAKPKRSDPELREELAGMYASQGRHDDAIAIYDELRVDAPDDLDLLDGLIDACLASATAASSITVRLTARAPASNAVRPAVRPARGPSAPRPPGRAEWHTGRDYATPAGPSSPRA